MPKLHERERFASFKISGKNIRTMCKKYRNSKVSNKFFIL